MALQQTSGNATADAYGGGVAAIPNYIESVFSTWLYDGTGATLSINNGIDLSTKGGMVWLKSRSNINYHYLNDTARGVQHSIYSNDTSAQATTDDVVTAFNSNGFTLGTAGGSNTSARTYASWTWRKQPKFFDVVTYTGTGSNTTIAHALGSVPGCIVVKRTDTTGAWQVYHRSLANTEYLVLNTTAATATGTTRWNSTTPTSTVFSLGTDASVNASGGTYVAYIYAHNAGGFGLTGLDNVISCGTWTENGAVQDINLGYEPQFIIVKNASSAANWFMFDTMRGWSTFNGACQSLVPNLTQAEVPLTGFVNPTATGFRAAPYDGSGQQQIYIAIRRGPMKVPTLGTSVYNAVARTGTGTTASITGLGFPPDLTINKDRGGSYGGTIFRDRLRGIGYTVLSSVDTDSEQNDPSPYCLKSFDMGGISYGTDGSFGNANGFPYINYFMGRAPGFFDEVCYTGTGSNTTFTHNLGVVPELIFVKRRDATGAWDSYCSALANTEYVVLNTTAAKATGATRWNSTTPTSSVFSVGTSTTTNASAGTYVAYLFATCPGVSKVGSYTGNGTTQTINCSFTSGARFVLIKRTDATGNWYTYDTVRGMTVLTDPYLWLNSYAGEVATLGSVTTVSTGFALNESILAGINTSAATYIFLAIA